MKISTKRARVMRCTHRRRRIARLIWRWCNCPYFSGRPRSPQIRRERAKLFCDRHRVRKDMRNALKGI